MLDVLRPVDTTSVYFFIRAEMYFRFELFLNQEYLKQNFSLDVTPKSAMTLGLPYQAGSVKIFNNFCPT
jgi:hypothetical protein